MIGAKTSVDSPLAAESAGAGPGKKTGEDEKDNGERDLPGLQGPFPETPLPQKRVGNGDKQYAPASAPVHLFGRLLALLGSEERRKPNEPSHHKDGVGVFRHGSDLIEASVRPLLAIRLCAGPFAQRPQG